MVQTASRSPRTQEERTEAAKSRIKEAALELFGRQGYEVVTLAAISLRAGYSRALAQYHYPDKTSLALELLSERMARDNHADLLSSDGVKSADEAWARLRAHFVAVKAYYGALHGQTRQSAALRGEMALTHAATMTDDPAIRDLVNKTTSDLVGKIRRLFEICATHGALAKEADPHALAVVHVNSIWGLALALFANPKGAKRIAAAFDQHWRLIEGARTRR